MRLEQDTFRWVSPVLLPPPPSNWK